MEGGPVTAYFTRGLLRGRKCKSRRGGYVQMKAGSTLANRLHSLCPVRTSRGNNIGHMGKELTTSFVMRKRT